MTTENTIRERFVNWLRHFNRRVTNPIMLTFAGRRIYAVVLHVGRKSGRPYRTPVLAMPWNQGVIIPLPYGQGTDWGQNVLAAQGCRLEWSGREYVMVAPRLVGRESAMGAFPGWLHALLRHTHEFMRPDFLPGPTASSASDGGNRGHSHHGTK